MQASGITKRLGLRLLFLFLLFLILLILTRNSRAHPAITWMYIYHPSDFSTVEELFEFVKGLKVPIPMPIAVAEVINYWFSGNTDWIDVVLYRSALIGGYLVVLSLSKGVQQLICGFSLSVLFGYASVVIHRGNPQIYDLLYSFFLISAIALWSRVRSMRDRPSVRGFLALLLGISLSMTEMMRPFFIVLLPPFVLLLFWGLKESAAKRSLLWALLPVILFSGSWHLHQWREHGQFAWSNHVGFNLQRVWLMVDTPPLLQEPKAANRAFGNGTERLPNLNTEAHTMNSRRLRNSILEYMIAHPLETVQHTLIRTAYFLLVPDTQLYFVRLTGPFSLLYKTFVIAVSLSFISYGLLMLKRLLSGRAFRGCRPDERMLCFFLAVSTSFLLAVGETGEEARFLISILPLLAFFGASWLPIVFRFKRTGT